jgi:hypothetical protein
MSETLNTAESLTEYIPQQLVGPSVAEQTLTENRADFVNQLVACDVISTELEASGALDRFIIDPQADYDALSHILIGDEQGGAHHLQTIMIMNVPDRMIASQLTGSKTLSDGKLQRRQAVQADGTFHPRQIVIDGKEKMLGSAMFPNEWSTENVIESLLAVSMLAPSQHDRERGTFIHEGIVGGVGIRVICDEKTGKIVTGFPTKLRK